MVGWGVVFVPEIDFEKLAAMDMSDSKVSHAHQSKEYQERKLKAYSRKIKPSWYEKYSWISVCTSKFKINTPWQNCQSFTLRFATWRKALQYFQEHENSMAHKEIEQGAIYKDILSEVDKVLKIFFIFPVTNDC